MKQILPIVIVIILSLISTLSAQEITKNFDQPIDPDVYLIRPGDQLLVTFVNADLDSLLLTVNAEGRIVNQTLGVFELSGTTLSSTRKQLTKTIEMYYNVANINIDINRIYEVTISISGSVKEPGVYNAFTSDRVSDIIEKAGGILNEGSHRRITFAGGPNKLQVDLDRSSYLGDLKADPCLYGGRHIFVPGKSDSYINVTGEVNHSREVELLADDNLGRIISICGGYNGWADTKAVKVLKSDNVSGNPEKLEKGDIIIVPPKQVAFENKVSLFGAVNKPGNYSLDNGSVSLESLVSKAGGLIDDANIRLLTIFRQPRFDITGKLTKIRYPISNFFNNDENLASVTVQPGDSVFIPVKVGYVSVSGQVLNPGYYPYQNGKDAQFYIDNAGGFLPTAVEDEVGIYNPISNTVTSSPLKVIVSDGSELRVKLREELK